MANHPSEKDARFLRAGHGVAVKSPNRKRLDQSCEEESEGENQRETVTGAAKMHQSISHKSEAKKAADDFEIAKQYETRGEIALSQPGGKREYTAKSQEAKHPLITEKVPADFLLAKHGSPQIIPHGALEGNAGVGWYSTLGALRVQFVEGQANH